MDQTNILDAPKVYQKLLSNSCSFGNKRRFYNYKMDWSTGIIVAVKTR